MIKIGIYRGVTILVLSLLLLPSAFRAAAQGKSQETTLKREVTLYNPYKPSLPEIKKVSFLPDMTDTVKVKPEFHYTVSAKPFQPQYTISPIKAASLLPDPLPKLYKSYIKLGFGNHVSPLAELSITNERSKKGSFGFYGHHFSTNDDLMLDNGKSTYAGYMDNDASLFGKKFFKKSILGGSVDFAQRVRHAYGYDPMIFDYSPGKDDIRQNYTNLGGKASFESSNLDSADFYFDFDPYYNYFKQSENYFQHNFGVDGIMAKMVRGFYAGSGASFVYYNNSDSSGTDNTSFIASLNPFLKKRTDQWNFKLGFQMLWDRNSILHFYPDFELGFSIVPSYLGFFATLSGKMERNEPLKVISGNPYLVRDQFPSFVSNGALYRLPDTDHKIIVNAGIKGNTGIGGNYLISASYSKIDHMLFYTNIVFPDTISPRAMGNYFLPISESADVINLHAEMNGPIGNKLSFSWKANYYKYTLNQNHAWNKPDWDGQFGLKYNLRDKILAGLEVTTTGKRWQVVNGDLLSHDAGYSPVTISMPANVNINFTAEYRYSRILSFWARLNNINFGNYYEWAYYPTQGFIGMLGFTYSL